LTCVSLFIGDIFLCGYAHSTNKTSEGNFHQRI